MKFFLKYLKYILIIFVAFLLSRGLSTTVFVSSTPQINMTFMAGMMDSVRRGDLLANTVALFDIRRAKPTSVPQSEEILLSEETKANLIKVSAVAPRVDADGIQIREYGNVAQITIPRKLLEGK
jgi:hypothetical protein